MEAAGPISGAWIASASPFGIPAPSLASPASGSAMATRGTYEGLEELGQGLGFLNQCAADHWLRSQLPRGEN